MSAKKRPPKAALEQAIRDTGGNLTATAARLHITRPTLYKWIYQFGIERLAGVTLESYRPTDGDDPRMFSVRLPATLHRWVRGHAVMTDRPAYMVVVEALELLRAVVEAKEEQP